MKNKEDMLENTKDASKNNSSISRLKHLGAESLMTKGFSFKAEWLLLNYHFFVNALLNIVYILLNAGLHIC